MARNEAAEAAGLAPVPIHSSSPQRKRSHDDLEPSPELDGTPSKRPRGTDLNGRHDDSHAATSNGIDARETERPASTPRRRGRPPKTNGGNSLQQTPVKAVHAMSAPTPQRLIADRSARRKSARALMDQVVRSTASDEEHDVDDELAREIYESSDQEDDEGQDDVASASQTTPSKATPGAQRPRQRRRASPSPPRDLPPHEQYFLDNKPGRPKTSNNTLSSLSLLTYDEYFELLRRHEDPHAAEVDNLEALHAQSFPQWAFEVSQGFSLCLYGYGSKRAVLRRFAKHLHGRWRRSASREGQTIMVNGYAPAANIREILSLVVRSADPAGRIPTSQPTAMIQALTARLSGSNAILTIVVNSLDAPPLRKPGAQAILAQLAASPQVRFVCSVDTPDFPLLWDIGARTSFNFAFHDCTTFAPFQAELDVVDDVHELLGRKARRVNGREGVAFVLRSLPENGKNLFRLLVGELLIAMEEDGTAEDAGVEYKMVYNKAVEEFICTSEMAFRTLLKEQVAPKFGRCGVRASGDPANLGLPDFTIIKSLPAARTRWERSC